MPFQPWTPVPPTQAVEQFNNKVLATIVTEDGVKKLITIGKMQELKYYDSRAFAISGIERDYILKDAKLILQRGIKQGLANREIMAQLHDLFNEYIPSGVIADGKLVSAARLENIVRTNVSDAVNQGRRAMRSDALVRGFVPFVMWSSVVDDRTCFPAGTMVMTSEGEKAIESVEKGDGVITHTGEMRSVLATHKRMYAGKCVRLKVAGREVVCTIYHPFYDGEKFVRAGDLKAGDKVACLERENE